MGQHLKFKTYDYASFGGYIMYAACTMVIPVCLLKMSSSLEFGLTAGGALHFCRSIFMLISMLCCTYIASRFGKARPLGTGLLVMGIGMSAIASAPTYGVLLAAMAFAGLGKGLFESLVTPFIQDRHREDQPGRYINFTHAFWSIGVVMGVVAATAAVQLNVSWRIITGVCGLMTLIPGIIFFTARQPEQNSSGTPGVLKRAAGLLGNRRFLLFLLMLFMAGGSEHCLLFWTPSFIHRELGGGAIMCGAATVIFASGMILGRLGVGVFLRQNRLFTVLITAAGAGMTAGIIAVFVHNTFIMFGMMFLLGIASGPLWPSIQSYCVERLKDQEATLMLILLPCVGIPGCGFFPWLMGIAGEFSGFRNSFFMIPLCHFLLLALLLFEYISYRKESLR